MRLTPRNAAQLAMITLAAVSFTACASKKPMAVATAPAMATPSNPTPDAPRNSGAPTSSVATRAPAASTAPVPGSAQDFAVNVGDRVFFDYDQHEVRSDAQSILDAQAQWLNRYPSVAIRIEGNADERGTREYNFALGARRASSVRDYLVSKGVSSGRIDTVSYGKERPIDGGANEQAWSRNRNGHTAITGGSR